MREIIQEIENLIAEFKNPFLGEMFSQISHGKMLRSSLVLAIAGKSKESLRLCAIIELIQLASLLHDDVIDESQMRRGKASLNACFGSKNAVMLGDALYSKAFYYLASFPTPIAQSLSNAVCKLSSGEVYDVCLSQSFNASIDQYYTMIEEKTASLIASSAECSAILAGLDGDAYFHYGKCLGIAFQIIDDLLDLTQTQEILGKPAMSDFKEGKMTLPYLLLYEKLGEKDKEKLKKMWQKELLKEEEQWIKQKMQEHQSIQKSRDIAFQFANDSLSKLKKPYNPKLKEVIESMLERSF